MAETSEALRGVKCPGCHFECMLEKYQCGRGQEFYELALAGGEVPERRGPVMTPSERAASGGDGKPPLNNRVMHGFNVLANVLQQRHVEAGERKVVLALSRAGSFMSLPFLAKRMLLSVEEMDAGLQAAYQLGYITSEYEERIGWVARLTDAGREQAAVWEAERDARSAEFLSPLSEEEKQALEVLMRKLMVRR